VLGGDPKTGAPSAQAAQLLDPALAASGQKAGYTFAVTCGSKVTINNQDVYNSFEITGVPQTIGKTGDNGYCSDENNIIKIDPAGGTNCTQASQ
jgi:type IV pilus assembly protein PilA